MRHSKFLTIVSGNRSGQMSPYSQVKREREVYYKVPTFLCGNTPATLG